MTNFEYFIELLKDNEDLVEQINNMDTAFIPQLVNSVCDEVDIYYEFEEN